MRKILIIALVVILSCLATASAWAAQAAYPRPIKRVQRGSESVALSGGAYTYQTATITIPSAVADTSKTSIRINSAGAYSTFSYCIVWTLTDSTTITVYIGIKAAGTVVLRWEATEYYDTHVQRASETFTPAAGTGNETITFTVYPALDSTTYSELRPCLSSGDIWVGETGYWGRYLYSYLSLTSEISLLMFDGFGAVGTYRYAYEIIY